MAYFAMQYQVLFHDTMAYGTHHHTVNVKFQNIARETLLFHTNPDVEATWTEQLKDIVMLTREAYSLNLEPVALGGKVAILMTYEEPTRSTVRLCFRVMDHNGKPVSCGYQVMVLVHKDTHQLVPAPALLTQYLDTTNGKNIIEPLTNPSLVVQGGFDEAPFRRRNNRRTDEALITQTLPPNRFRWDAGWSS